MAKKRAESPNADLDGFPFADRSHRRAVHAPMPGVCGGTDVGMGRANNEDTFFVSDDGRILVAADGLGGHAAGDVASEIAARFVAEFLFAEDAAEDDSDPERVGALLAAAVHGAHEAVVAEAASDAGKEGMGTTLICAVVSGDVAYIAHVGDARGYLYAGGELIQVTDDHSPVGELVAKGVLTKTEARSHPDRHLISQAIGLDPGVEPELNEVDLVPGDAILLCSDGLVDTLTDNEIRWNLAQGWNARDEVIALLDRANEAGAADNVTAVIYRKGA